MAPSRQEMVLLVEVERLKHALRQAILNTTRVKRVCVDFDPAGSTYDLQWTVDTLKWAAYCDLDLTKLDPSFYDRR